MNAHAPRIRLRAVLSLKSALILISLIALGLAGWREYERRQAVERLIGRMTPTQEKTAFGGFCFCYSLDDPLEGYIARIQGLHIEHRAVPRVVQALRLARAANDSIAGFYAERALIRLGPRAALEEFVGAARGNGSGVTRALGFEGLTQLAGWHPEFLPQIRAAIAPCFDDPDESFVADAVYTLTWIEQSDNARHEFLIHLLDHPNDAARLAAANEIGNVTPYRRDTLDRLRSHLHDRDERVREAVRKSMHQILADPQFEEEAAGNAQNQAAAGGAVGEE